MIHSADKKVCKVFINPNTTFNPACSRGPRPSVVSSDYSDEEEILTTQNLPKPTPDKR